MEEITLLTPKQIRYAMIKGIAERRNPYLRPEHLWGITDRKALNSFVEDVIMEVEDKEEYEFN